MRVFSSIQLSLGLFPLAVVGMVVIMMIPLPLMVLDGLLMLNIALAVILLLAVIYTVEAEQLTSLPTLLLLATIFRLGINVSTTRQILAEGVAPSTVAAFGNFVVHGNLVVGAVVFAIITLVQFLVIAKGSERVAEVAARFALDAMPGKQMSIDADVRSGILSLTEAKRRRERLQRESKLYGSLDGAMKFVKGDAIAGLCITLVNVFGGLFIGVYQHSLSILDSLQRYTLYAIGDGLSSQIPALLVAVAAGVAVTRVSGERGLLLADDVSEQLTTEPKVIISSGVVLLLIGCMPGLSGFMFWSMSAFLLFFGAFRLAQQQQMAKVQNDETFRPSVAPGLLLYLSARAANYLQHNAKLSQRAQELREEIFESTGLFIQDIQFEIKSQWSEVRIELVYQSERVAQNEWPTSENSNALDTELSNWIMESTENFLFQRSTELIDDTMVRILFEVHRNTSEDLINSLVPNKLSVTEVTAILKQLNEESVSCRNFSRILQALAEVEFLERSTSSGSSIVNVNQLRLAAVRKKLRRQICHKLQVDGVIEAYFIDSELAQLAGQQHSLSGVVDPRVAESLLDTVHSLLEAEKNIILVCCDDSRFAILSVLRAELSRVSVLAASEIEPEYELSVISVISAQGLDVDRSSQAGLEPQIEEYESSLVQ